MIRPEVTLCSWRDVRIDSKLRSLLFLISVKSQNERFRMNSLLDLAFSTKLVQHTEAMVGPGVPEVVILNQ